MNEEKAEWSILSPKQIKKLKEDPVFRHNDAKEHYMGIDIVVDEKVNPTEAFLVGDNGFVIIKKIGKLRWYKPLKWKIKLLWFKLRSNYEDYVGRWRR